MGQLAVPAAPSRGRTEHARSHAAMQPEERWDGMGQRMRGCGWASEIPARLLEEWLRDTLHNGGPIAPLRYLVI